LEADIVIKQKKREKLREILADLYADIEYAQDQLDQMQEKYDRYFIPVKSCILLSYLTLFTDVKRSLRQWITNLRRQLSSLPPWRKKISIQGCPKHICN
jgi:hypothetical protein